MSKYELYVLIGKQVAVIESYKDLLRNLESGFTSVEEITAHAEDIEKILKDI